MKIHILLITVMAILVGNSLVADDRLLHDQVSLLDSVGCAVIETYSGLEFVICVEYVGDNDDYAEFIAYPATGVSRHLDYVPV